MNPDFVRLAHRKAIWAELQRVLLDKYVASDGPPKEEIICEEVPYAQKDVTNEAVLEVLETIQQHELDEQLEMRQYEFKKRERHAKRNEEQPEHVDPDPQPDAPGPVPILRIANGDRGARNAVVTVASPGESSRPPSSEEEGSAPRSSDGQPAPAPPRVDGRDASGAPR